MFRSSENTSIPGMRSRRQRDVEEARRTGALVSVFLVGCQGLSRGAIEESVTQSISRESRAHDMHNLDHRELRLYGPGASTAATRMITDVKLFVQGQYGEVIVEAF